MDGIEDLERWAADARAREAADSRVRERRLRSQAEDEASLAGVLVGLAERGDTVVITTVGGRRHRGRVAGVGLDFAALGAPGGPITLVALQAVADVKVAEAPRPPPAAAGDRPGRASFGALLADVLAQAAGQRPRLSVQAGVVVVVGDLRAVGVDVLTLRTDGAPGLVYVRLASVSEVSFLASG